MPEMLSVLLQEFILESNEGLQDISEKLTHLEKNPGNSEEFNAIYRVIHTIKGGSRFLKLTELEALTHSLESVLDLVRDGVLEFSPAFNDLLLVGIDYIQAHIKSLEATGKEANLDTTVLKAGIVEFAKSAVPRDSQETSATTDDILKVADADVETSVIPDQTTVPTGQVGEISDSVSESIESSSIIAEEVAALNSEKSIHLEKARDIVNQSVAESGGGEKSLSEAVVRVNVNLLDKIMNVVGELVLTRNQIVQLANSQESGDLVRLSSQLNSITSELQSDIMTTRMQPIGSILNRFERIVRDMARDLGKKITLKIEGKDTELDKTLLEAIKDPLTHMVRNAVDHGMETIDERREAGKSEEGTIVIKAYHEGGQVTIEINDDGRGINKQKILAKAEEKGLIKPEDSSRLSDKEIYNLIFLPGFSTANQVTNISGRGVGMDVVKTNIEKIGGHIEIQTELGKGSNFKMRIPLTLAIIPALIVSAGEESFAIPQINLVELVRLEGDKLQQIEKIKESEFFRLRGNIIPLARLRATLGLSDDLESESVNIVILSADGALFGLIVDQILDTQEIVVKPLSKQIKNIGVYAGATIMGDGHVALILDVQGVAARTSLERRGAGADRSESMESALVGSMQDILLFNLSSKGIYAVPLSVVSRLEEFDRNKVDYSGIQPIIKYREQPMPLLFLDVILGLTDRNPEMLPEVIPAFVLTIDGLHYGFVVDRILDVTPSNFEVNRNGIEGRSVLGTLFVNDKAVTIIDIYDVADRMKLGLRKKTLEITNGRRPTALIVEDTPMFRTLAVNILREMGFEILVATNGKEGLEVLEKNRSIISIVLSDIEMPLMNGYEFARAVRSKEEYNNIPLIAITTRNSSDDIKRGRESGFDVYLEKFKKEEIVAAVQKNLEGKI